MMIDVSNYQAVFDEILDPDETVEEFVWSAIRQAIGMRTDNIANAKFIQAKRELAMDVIDATIGIPHGDGPSSIKIARIKAYCLLSGTNGLKEAKNWVESAYSENGSGEIL